MCGIAGGWFPRKLAPGVLEAALAKIVHRGPDDQGVMHDPPVHFGMRRLSIIDLETGKRPDGPAVIGLLTGYRLMIAQEGRKTPWPLVELF